MIDLSITDNIEAASLAYEFWDIKLKDAEDKDYMRELLNGLDDFKNQRKELLGKKLYEQVIVIDEVIRILINEVYEIE